MTALEIAADADDGRGRLPVCDRTLELMRHATGPWNPAHHEVWPAPFLRSVEAMQMVKLRVDRIVGVQEEQQRGGGGSVKGGGGAGRRRATRSSSRRARVAREVEVLSEIDRLLFVHHIMSFCGRDWFG